MALVLDDSALVIASRGAYFIIDKNVDLPTGGINVFAQHILAGKALPSGFDILGHTSRENMHSPEFDGGDAEQKGTWEDAAARQIFSEETLSFELGILQHDKDTMLKIMNGWETVHGGIALPTSGRQFDGGIVGLIIDGEYISGFWYPNCSIRLTGLPSLSTEDFSEFTTTVSPKTSSLLTDSATGRGAARTTFPPALYVAPVVTP